MREVPFDLPRLTAIWQEINAHDDERLRSNKDEVSRKFQAVIDNPLSFLQEPSAPLSPKEIMLYLLDVMNFIHGVNCFYDKLASYRPLTSSDKEVGKNLSVLLKQAQENMTSLKKWNLAVLAAEEQSTFNDRPVATKAKEAV